jgi:hypothetical protein
MALTQQLTGTKAEFLDYLQEQARNHQALVKDAAGPAKIKHQGHVEGLEHAWVLVNAWQIVTPPDAPETTQAGNGLSAQPVVTAKAWNE